MVNKKSKAYSCWLSHTEIKNSRFKGYLGNIVIPYKNQIVDSALSELKKALEQVDHIKMEQKIYENEEEIQNVKYIRLEKSEDVRLISEGYKIKHETISEEKQGIIISAKDDNGILYGVFALLRLFEQNKEIEGIEIIDNPKKNIRMVDHWDNLDGTVERGFAGSSILFESCRNKEIMKEAMDKTNKLMEFQITQEYTGQQKHVCFLVPWWKEVLNTPTYAKFNKEESSVYKASNLSTDHEIEILSSVDRRIDGIAAVVNVGSDENWTGHFLAQANLYGYGRIAWNSDISGEEIVEEWIKLTFGDNPLVMKNTSEILLNSWKAYEKYTSPLGIGWMVSPGHHYGPDVDGYEFSPWGTYHRADCRGIGIDRTLERGTGYTGQYNEPLKNIYNNLETCPDELLLFFHHVPYTHVLASGKTVIQHIYDNHFEGFEAVEKFIDKWNGLEEFIDKSVYVQVLERLNIQLDSAREWRDQVNTYFYRMSGIDDEKGRKVYS